MEHIWNYILSETHFIWFRLFQMVTFKSKPVEMFVRMHHNFISTQRFERQKDTRILNQNSYYFVVSKFILYFLLPAWSRFFYKNYFISQILAVMHICITSTIPLLSISSKLFWEKLDRRQLGRLISLLKTYGKSYKITKHLCFHFHFNS